MKVRADKIGKKIREYIGVGSCILGYPANGFPEPIERKADYYKIIR